MANSIVNPFRPSSAIATQFEKAVHGVQIPALVKSIKASKRDPEHTIRRFKSGGIRGYKWVCKIVGSKMTISSVQAPKSAAKKTVAKKSVKKAA